MKPANHNLIIAHTAKSVLAPIGCSQKGRSRTWLDDHGWWVGIIEFQPSQWSKMSYLNVSACFLWHEKDYYSFDDGDRLPEAADFKNPEQFGRDMLVLAESAKKEVFRLRSRHATIERSAKYLIKKKRNNFWDYFSRGIASGLNGDSSSAREAFAAMQLDPADYNWNREGKRLARRFDRLVDDRGRFCAEIAEVVRRTRKLLKLPAREIGF